MRVACAYTDWTSPERDEEHGRAYRVAVPSFTRPGGTEGIGPKLAEIGRTADGAGFLSLRVVDHFFQIEYVGAAEEPMLEGYSALNFLAGMT